SKDGSRIAALMQERDILQPGAAEEYLGDNFENDLHLRLQLLDDFLQGRRAQGLKAFSANIVLEAAKQFEQLVSKTKITTHLTLEEILLKSFSNQLCRRRGKTEKALMVGGRGVRLGKESVVRNSEFF